MNGSHTGLVLHNGITVPFLALHLTYSSHVTCDHRQNTAPVWLHLLSRPDTFCWVGDNLSLFGAFLENPGLVSMAPWKSLQVAKILWGSIFIWLNTSNCMNIHGNNMALQGFIHIFLGYHITWGCVWGCVCFWVTDGDPILLQNKTLCFLFPYSLILVLSKSKEKFLLIIMQIGHKRDKKRGSKRCSSTITQRNEIHV